MTNAEKLAKDTELMAEILKEYGCICSNCDTCKIGNIGMCPNDYNKAGLIDFLEQEATEE